MKTIGIGLVGCGASRWMFAPCFRFLQEGHLAAVISSWKKTKIALPLTHTGPLDEAFLAARRGIASIR